MSNPPRVLPPLVDIHCHLLPGIDDGAASQDVSLAMARLAVDDGVKTIVATPHQLGAHAGNSADGIRLATRRLQRVLREHRIPLRILPGADVRIEPDLARKLASGEVLTLGDRLQHVLLELPHELYFSLQPLLNSLGLAGITGILSHPERNHGLLRQPELVAELVDAGCLMQITAGSLSGAFGAACQDFCRRMLSQGLVHFVASDAHGVKSRRPLLRRAYEEVLQLTDEETANDLCANYPQAVVDGGAVPAGRRPVFIRKQRGWFRWRKAG